MAHSWRLSSRSSETIGEDFYGNLAQLAAECRADDASIASQPQDEQGEPPTGPDSPGYLRNVILRTHILPAEKKLILFCMFFAAIWQSFDNFLRVQYQYEITFGSKAAEKLGGMNAMCTLAAASLTPLISKSADIYGRPETLLSSILLYVLGTLVQAASVSFIMFYVGNVTYIVGFLGTISMFEIIVADLVSTRMRVVMFYIPAMPYLATTWVNDFLEKAIYQVCPSWRWRLAWSAVIYLACSLALVISTFAIEDRTRKRVPDSETKDGSTSTEGSLRVRLVRQLLRFRQMDALGWLCFSGSLLCLISPWADVPLVALQGATTGWTSTRISVTVVGAICIPMFYFVEKHTKYPIFPTKLLTKRIMAALIMGFLYHLAFYVQCTYLYFLQRVLHSQDRDDSLRIVAFYGFFSTLVGIVVGFFIVVISRDLKWCLRFGALFYLAAFVVQYVRPNGADDMNRFTVMCSQALFGVAGALFPFPALAFISDAREHAQLSTLMGAYMTACRIGSGVGQALAGAIWMNTLRPQLYYRLADLLHPRLIERVYTTPLDYNAVYSFDPLVQAVIIDCFTTARRHMTMVGILASTLMIILAFLIRKAPFGAWRKKQDMELEPQGRNAFEIPVPPPLQYSRFPIFY